MKSNKRTLILLSLLALTAIVGFPMIKKNLSQGDGAIDHNATSPEAVGAVTKVLQDIENIELDFSILESREWNYLSDFNLPLVNIPIGKTNPFSN